MSCEFISIGFFDLRIECAKKAVRSLDRSWLEQRFGTLDPELDQGLWIDDATITDHIFAGAVYDRLEDAKEIVIHHGQGCVITDSLSCLVLYPPSAIVEQASCNDWPPPYRSDGVGRYREALERNMSGIGRNKLCVGPPSTEARLSAVESDLGTDVPKSLREMYLEFDGVWFNSGTTVDLARPDADFYRDMELFTIMPVSRLRRARDYLDDQWYSVDIKGFAAELPRAVVFSLPEAGASFKFMTDSQAWGIPTGHVGQWDHDGGDADSLADSLEEYLRSIGRLRHLRRI